MNRNDAVVLRGRAYERESMAYKAADGVLDALSQCLVAFEKRGEIVSLPGDAWALAHLFPVLKRAPGIPAERADDGDDPLALRQRAFGALRDILWQLARLGPTVLHLDDVQWGDVDSAMLLLEVLRPPAPPPILVILGYRDDPGCEDGPFLRCLNDCALDGSDLRDIPGQSAHPGRGAPPRAERARRGRRGRAASGRGHRVRLGGQRPLRRGPGAQRQEQGLRADADAFVADAGPTLEEMIRRRVARLDDGARCLLELASVHGQPIRMSTLSSAAGGDRLDSQIGDLRERRFVRIGMRDGREAVEAAHDRIRQAVVANLSPDLLKARHRQLAVACELEHDIDPEAIVGHWFEAGESEQAAKHAERAAERASDKLAFDRATQLYRLTLSALPAESLDADSRPKASRRGAQLRGPWRRSCADVPRRSPLRARTRADVARASGRESAPLLWRDRRGDAHPPPHSGPQRTRRAEVGVDRRAWFIFYSAWLRIIGLRVVPRPPDELPRRTRNHIEVMYATAAGLALVDVMIGASLVVRFLTVALRTRHRFAIASERSSVRGSSRRSAARRPKRNARSWSSRTVSRDAGVGLAPSAQSTRATHALRAFLRGRWREAYELCESAYTTLPTSRGIWAMHALAVYGEFALVYLGEPQELARRLRISSPTPSSGATS